jgi:RNA polymerase sigma factor (sigma-70 family)
MLSTSSTVWLVRGHSIEARENAVNSRSAESTEALFHELQPLILSLIKRYGTDHDQRQDLVGEIYCRFHLLIDAYDASRGVPLKAYLIHSLPRGVHTWARSQWRRERRERLLIDDEAERLGGVAEDPATLIMEAFRKEERREIVNGALTRLSDRQREAVAARYQAERSYDDISRSMGVEQVTVRSLVRHGISSMQRHIERRGTTLD